jgi:hypothetical protein
MRDRQTDRRTDNQRDEQTVIQMEGQIDRQMNGGTDWIMNKQVSVSCASLREGGADRQTRTHVEKRKNRYIDRQIDR